MCRGLAEQQRRLRLCSAPLPSGARGDLPRLFALLASLQLRPLLLLSFLQLGAIFVLLHARIRSLCLLLNSDFHRLALGS
jgi:hypothetical protein